MLKGLHPYKRSPLLVAAYCTLAFSIVLVFLGAGMYGTVGTAGIAVVLALGEVVVQLSRRSERTLLLVAKVAGAFGTLVALVGLFLIADSFITQDEYLSRGVAVTVGGAMLAVIAYGTARWLPRDRSGERGRLTSA
jgi:hypothetical protein